MLYFEKGCSRKKEDYNVAKGSEPELIEPRYHPCYLNVSDTVCAFFPGFIVVKVNSNLERMGLLEEKEALTIAS